MNKGELVDAIADKASVTKKQADAVLSAALETVVEAVSSGSKVTLDLGLLSPATARLVKGETLKLAIK
jgi:DNA-binding protein HU-beta